VLQGSKLQAFSLNSRHLYVLTEALLAAPSVIKPQSLTVFPLLEYVYEISAAQSMITM